MKRLRIVEITLAISLVYIQIAAPAPAQAGERNLLDLLERVPVSAFQAGWLSYANLTAIVKGAPGAMIPQDVKDFERHADTPEGSATLQAYMELSAGPSDLFQNLFRAQEMLESSGIDFFTIQEVMELGTPPSRQVWLSGSFDQQSVLSRLSAKGYQPSLEEFPGVEVWGLEGRIDGGMTLNLKMRDPAFPFGGNLGQSWPVVLEGNLLFSSPDEALIRAAVEGAEPSLASLSLVRDTASSASFVSFDETGTLIQLYMLTPDAAGLKDVSPPDAQMEGPLPAFQLFSLSHLFTADAQLVLIGLTYSDPDSADAAVNIVSQRYAEARIMRSGELLRERLAGMGGRAGEPFTVKPEGGSNAVILPFVFPKAAGDAPLAFRFFTNLLLSRDLGWLGSGQ